jgi:hypothetical protein
MPPVTPKATPTPLSESFEATTAKLQQGALLRGLREGLLKANVARATVGATNELLCALFLRSLFLVSTDYISVAL